MKVGTVKEIKTHEYRVGITPACVQSYVSRGHTVLVQESAGTNAGFEDAEYKAAGAQLVPMRETVFAEADMIVKVKEPLEEEYPLLRKDQILYTYLHLAASRELTDVLIERNVKAVAYETIRKKNGNLPCLKPMSEIAGRLSVQEGAKYLEKTFGGRGILLGGVPGVHRGKVTILGGGTVGTNACKIAVGMGAEVTVLDIDAERLEYLDDIFSTHITTLYSSDHNLAETVEQADLVIGAVLVPGAKAPQLLKREHIKAMKKGAVLVDVAIDQGGCAGTSRPTTHSDPIFVVDNVVHYCVTNMPGAVALSSTKALTSATLPYGLMIAEKGLENAMRQSTALKSGVNTYAGACTCQNVAEALEVEYRPVDELL